MIRPPHCARTAACEVAGGAVAEGSSSGVEDDFDLFGLFFSFLFYCDYIVCLDQCGFPLLQDGKNQGLGDYVIRFLRYLSLYLSGFIYLSLSIHRRLEKRENEGRDELIS